MSTVEELLLDATPETSRTIEPTSDRWRRHIYTDDLDGMDTVSLIGITSQLKPLKGSFEDYAAKVVARWAVENHGTWKDLEVDEAVGLIAGERYRKLNRDANRGSSIHRIIDSVREGNERVVVSNPDAAPYLKAVKRFLAEAQPEFVYGELAVFNRALGYAGKFDVGMRLGAFPELGLAIGDWKTRAEHRVYVENAAQLSGYAHAEYFVLDGQRQPMPRFDSGIIVTFAPDGTWAVHPIDLEAAWPLCQAAIRCYQLDKTVKPIGTAVTVAQDLDAALEASLAATTASPPAPAVDDLEALLDAPPAPVALVGTDDAPVDPAFNNPTFIAQRVDYEKGRLAKVLELLDGRPLPIPRPAQLPPPGAPYETWEPVKLLGDWVTALEREVGAPFPDAAPQPPADPFDGFDKDRTEGGVAIVCSGRGKGGCQTVRVPPAQTPADEHARLKARFTELPVDLQATATIVAKGRGVADVTRLAKGQLIILDGVISEATEAWHARIEAVAGLLDGWSDDELALLVTAAAGERTPREFTDADVERLQALTDALAGGTLALTYDPDAAFTVDEAAPAIVARFGKSKSAAVTVAKTLAERHDRPKPKSFAALVADPVLTALVAHPRAAAGAETATSNQQGDST